MAGNYAGVCGETFSLSKQPRPFSAASPALLIRLPSGVQCYSCAHRHFFPTVDNILISAGIEKESTAWEAVFSNLFASPSFPLSKSLGARSRGWRLDPTRERWVTTTSAMRSTLGREREPVEPAINAARLVRDAMATSKFF